MVSILGANSVSGGYEVSNSLRLNDGDTPKLAITPNASNRKTWTFSAWVKRSSLSSNQRILSITGTNDFLLRFRGDDKLSFIDGSITSELITATKVFRDTSAWYHIVIVLDTTQGTASNRAKLYVNGYQETDLVNNSGGSAAYPSQNADGLINSNVLHTVGCRDTSGTVDQNVDGYLAEVHFIDGTAKSPTDFGEFDEDSGIWKPKEYSGSYGTNGFFLEFKQAGTSQNSSGIGADTSGQDNHLAVTNLAATDQTTDTPTNNFCTLNGVKAAVGSNSSNTPLFEGNLKASHTDNAYKQSEGTIFPTAGKWYWETFIQSSGNDAGAIGIVTSGKAQGAYPGTTAFGYGYDSYGSGSKIHNNSRDNSYGAGYTTDDIMGTALDLDNGTLTFYKNNTSQGQAYSGIDASLGWGYGHGSYYATNTIIVNFGQDGTFAGEQTAQGNSDANGYGNFYYAPPSGYYALCTKNLAEFG